MRLQIERMAYGADAIAHDEDGRCVFVTGGVPGDVVEAHVTETGKSFSRALVDAVETPSPSRVVPACPYASLCGGCPWSSLSRECQLSSKRANVVDSLTRIAHMPPEDAERLVAPMRSPGTEWGYRNKVELAVGSAHGHSLLGMHVAQGDGIVRVDSCPLFCKGASKLVKATSGALSYLNNSHDLGLERVGIRASERTGDVEVALWTTTGSFPRAQVSRVLSDATKATSVVRVMTKGPAKARRIAGVERLSGSGSWSERIGRETMRLSAPSFFQVNTLGAEELQRLVVEALEPTPTDVAMDLYSGAGTFTLPLARECSLVSAVESYGPAVRDLRRNLESAGIDNVDAAGGDAAREFPEDEADIIVVDPPRAGLAPEVVDLLCAQPARFIAYVSCDPATLARDLARFREDATFEVVSVTPVDLFPQTFHVETVVLMSRVEGK